MVLARFFGTVVAIAMAAGLAACKDEVASKPTLPQVVTYPLVLDKDCRNGRAKAYDECTDQLELFNQARLRARDEDKVLLVSYGAEWCIWCHVFDAHLKGQTTKFTYTYGDGDSDETWTDTLKERPKKDVEAEAAALTEFVSQNFVLVHIDGQYAVNGDEVLYRTGADRHMGGGIPFIFSIDRNGKFASTIDHDRVAVRRDSLDWYRGYDRAELLKNLQELHAAAL